MTPQGFGLTSQKSARWAASHSEIHNGYDAMTPCGQLFCSSNPRHVPRIKWIKPQT